MDQVHPSRASDFPDTHGAPAPRAERASAAAVAVPVLADEPGWPSECERLALLNTAGDPAGGLLRSGAQKVVAARFLTPGRRAPAAATSSAGAHAP